MRASQSASSFHSDLSAESSSVGKKVTYASVAEASKSSPAPLPKDGLHSDSSMPIEDVSYSVRAWKIFVLLLVVIGGPILCRNQELSSETRCTVVIICVLVLNLAEVMPLYCTAMFIPVLGTFCEVLGQQRSIRETAVLLASNAFNQISFLVLGALVINGIFVKCRLETRLIKYLKQLYDPKSHTFLLALLLGGMAMCSVLYSGSLVLLAALRPLILGEHGQSPMPANLAKRLLLGVAFCANAGSIWLPISSPVNLIVVSLLREFDNDVNLFAWISVALPVSILAMLAVWLLLLATFPEEEQDSTTEAEPISARHVKVYDVHGVDVEDEFKLTGQHYFFIAVSVLALVGITFFMPVLQPLVGHAVCISLCVVVMAFGSGFMTREDFLMLDWDLLMVVGGTNVMAFMVRETGLGATMSAAFLSSEIFNLFPYWRMLAILVIGTVTISTTVGHTLAGVLLLPLIVALGVKLQAAQTTALLCAIAVPFGMGLPHSSFDNTAAWTASRGLGNKHMMLSQKDFRTVGVPLTGIAVLLLLFLGYAACVFNYGLPPPVVISEVSKTPEKLKPKVAKENAPDEAEQVFYDKMIGDWDTFLKKPDKKAFAVGELQTEYKTRPWAASWGHVTQKHANKAALDACQRLAKTCRLIWPRGASVDEGVEDITEALEDEESVDVKAKDVEKHGVPLTVSGRGVSNFLGSRTAYEVH